MLEAGGLHQPVFREITQRIGSDVATDLVQGM